MARLIENHADPYRRRFTFPKWNGTVRVTQEHRLFRYLPDFRDWTSAQHVAEAKRYLASAISTERDYHIAVRELETTYGDHGPLISGIVREHFPEDRKEWLRFLCQSFNESYDRSLAHWQAARRHPHTWRAMRDQQRFTLDVNATLED